MNLLRVLRLRGASGADGPNRLIGHDERRESDRVEALGRGLHLTEHDVESLAGFPLLEAFAHAEDRDELVNEERAHLLAHAGVCFAEDLTALGMADDAMRATGIEQQRRAQLARERAGILPVRVLRREADRRALQGLGDRGERGRDRSENDLARETAPDAFGDGSSQRLGLGEGVV